MDAQSLKNLSPKNFDFRKILKIHKKYGEIRKPILLVFCI